MSTLKHDCPEMMDLLVDYLEDELDPDQVKQLELHLELCPPCMNFLDGYKQTGTVCREVLDKEMPRELKSSLHAFLSRKCCGGHEDG